VTGVGETRNAYRILTGNFLGKFPLGRSRRKWECGIKCDLRETGCVDGICVELAQSYPLAGDIKPSGSTVKDFVSFEAFTAVLFQVEDFWVVTLCSVVLRYQRFRDP